MRALTPAVAVCLVALAAGCGDDDDRAAGPGMQEGTQTAAVAPPTERHNELARPREERRRAEEAERRTEYMCDGRRLELVEPRGPAKVDPPAVRPGERFKVTITDPKASAVVVALAGASDLPISEPATPDGRKLVAILRMPSEATCGNKRLAIEGDVNAEASVAVRD